MNNPASLARSRGIALVSVLSVLVVLMSIAGTAVISGRTDARLSRNLIEISKARHMAEGGLRLGIAQLLSGNDAAGLVGTKSYSFKQSGYSITVSASNESGRIDLNFASSELLRGLLSQFVEDVDEAGALADAIVDWRDNDDDRHLQGAEAVDYQSAGLSYIPSNTNYLSVSELRLVLGMTEELYLSLQDAVTVHSRQMGIFPPAAGAKALRAAGGILPQESGEPAGESRIVAGLQRNFLARSPGSVYRLVSKADSGSNIRATVSAVVLLGPGQQDEPFRVIATGAHRGASEEAIQ